MKIQPVDPLPVPKGPSRTDPAKPVAKSRLKRLLEWQFPGVLRVSSAEKLAGGSAEQHCNKEGDLEPSSLAKMVQNFIEESNEKQGKCSRNRCNCFNGICSDDELDLSGGSADGLAGDTCEILKVNDQIARIFSLIAASIALK